MTTPNDLVPTSSPRRPATGDDLRNRARPSSPSPTGDELELASNTPHTNTTPTSSPGRPQIDIKITPTNSPEYPFLRMTLTLRLEAQRLIDHAALTLRPIVELVRRLRENEELQRHIQINTGKQHGKQHLLDSLTADQSSKAPHAGGR